MKPAVGEGWEGSLAPTGAEVESGTGSMLGRPERGPAGGLPPESPLARYRRMIGLLTCAGPAQPAAGPPDQSFGSVTPR